MSEMQKQMEAQRRTLNNSKDFKEYGDENNSKGNLGFVTFQIRTPKNMESSEKMDLETLPPNKFWNMLQSEYESNVTANATDYMFKDEDGLLYEKQHHKDLMLMKLQEQLNNHILQAQSESD